MYGCFNVNDNELSTQCPEIHAMLIYYSQRVFHKHIQIVKKYLCHGIAHSTRWVRPFIVGVSFASEDESLFVFVCCIWLK